MSGPVRVQLSRQKGWRMPPNTVKVDRTTKWGNPWAVTPTVDAAQAVEWFRDEHAPSLPVRELRGKNLACWCKLGEPCHAEVLLELANQSEIDRLNGGA